MSSLISIECCQNDNSIASSLLVRKLHKDRGHLLLLLSSESPLCVMGSRLWYILPKYVSEEINME